MEVLRVTVKRKKITQSFSLEALSMLVETDIVIDCIALLKNVINPKKSWNRKNIREGFKSAQGELRIERSVSACFCKITIFPISFSNAKWI